MYFECTDKTGILEWDARADKFVTLHQGIIGSVTGPASGDRVIVTNYDNSSATIIATGGVVLAK